VNQTNKLRQAIGWMAILSPIFLILGSWTGGIVPIRTSISAYYWATDSVLFVAMLSISGSFLLFYTGYDIADRIITNIAGFAMICVSIFPRLGEERYLFLFLSPEVTHVIHGISAAITFLLLGYMSMFQFTKSSNLSTATIGKLRRNRVYRFCGACIFVAIYVISIVSIIPGLRELTDQFRLFYWLESVILLAFGFSWTVKGGVRLSLTPSNQKKAEGPTVSPTPIKKIKRCPYCGKLPSATRIPGIGNSLSLECDCVICEGKTLRGLLRRWNRIMKREEKKEKDAKILEKYIEGNRGKKY
jgi:hypothetical protein